MKRLTFTLFCKVAILHLNYNNIRRRDMQGYAGIYDVMVKG